MTPLTFLLPLLLANSPAEAKAPVSLTVVRTASRFRVPLDENIGPVRVQLDAVAGEFKVIASGVARRKLLYTALVQGLKDSPCADVQRTRGAVLVQCTTLKLEVDVKRKGASTFLEVRELRGSPLTALDADVPRIAYDPGVMPELGGPCPGTTPVGRGECALMLGKFADAAAHFHSALATTDAPHAFLRLGDIAFPTSTRRAVALWRRAGKFGPYGRLARARICDVEGTCFDPLRPGHRYDFLDPVALEGAHYDEMVLRRARALMFEGRALEAAKVLIGPGRDAVAGHACRRAVTLCHRITIAAFEESTATQDVVALTLHSQLPSRTRGPYALTLSGLAAERAEVLGAPIYGAHALAAVTGQTPKADLEAHLAQTARLYLQGEDWARARVVIKFARSEFRGAMRTGPWPLLLAQLDAADRPDSRADDVITDDALAQDLVRARALLARLAESTTSTERDQVAAQVTP